MAESVRPGVARLTPAFSLAGSGALRDAWFTTDKPAYLGLLNAIANAETDAECYFGGWAAATDRDDVRRVIATVVLREGEHGKAFAKRICELGFGLQRKEAPDLADKCDIACSTELSDREKFERLGLVRMVDDNQLDIFSSMFNDTTIDIQTGALLGRCIAEERDTGRMLRACHGQLCCEEEMGSNGSVATTGSGKKARLAVLDARMGGIEAKLDQLLAR